MKCEMRLKQNNNFSLHMKFERIKIQGRKKERKRLEGVGVGNMRKEYAMDLSGNVSVRI